MVCFFEVWTPSTLVGINFLNSNPFLMIYNVSSVPIGGVQVCLDTKNNRALALHLAYLEHLSYHSWVVLPYIHVCFFLQFSQVGRLVIIHKMYEPNLGKSQLGKYNNFKILLCYGYLQEFIVEIWPFFHFLSLKI